MKTHNDSIASGVPTDWSFGGDRFSSAHDQQMNGLFWAWGDFAIAGGIHSDPGGIVTCQGTGNGHHSAVTGGKLNAQGHPLATGEQHGHAGRKRENGDRIYLPESQQDVHSPTPCPSRTRATCLSATGTRSVNYLSRYRKVSDSDQQVPTRLNDCGGDDWFGSRVADPARPLDLCK
jgi:hypothetical protein